MSCGGRPGGPRAPERKRHNLKAKAYMERTQKIELIRVLAQKVGFIPLPEPVNVNGRKCDTVGKAGVMTDIDGDMCLAAAFEGEVRDDDGSVLVPGMTDEQVDGVFEAVKGFCAIALLRMGMR